MLSLKLDNNWDITLDENGLLKMADPYYSIAQNVACAVRLFTRDAYFNTDLGIPHFDITFKANPSLSIIRSSIKEVALSVNGVKNAEVNINNENNIITGEILITFENGKTALIGMGVIGGMKNANSI